MKFLDGLTEALEAPDFSDEDEGDKWSDHPYVYKVKVEVTYGPDIGDQEAVQQVSEWFSQYGEAYEIRVEDGQVIFLAYPRAWQELVSSDTLDISMEMGPQHTGKPWGPPIQLNGVRIIRIHGEHIEGWA